MSFTKLYKVFWPCDVVDPTHYTPEMKAAVSKTRKSFIQCVKFFEEEEFHLVTSPSDLLPYSTPEKSSIIKKGHAQLRRTTPIHLAKYKSDVITMETRMSKNNRVAIETWFDELTMETPKNVGAIKSLFQKPTEVARKSPGVVVTTPKKKNVVVMEMQSGEKKRYPCDCGMSFDRVNALTYHRKSCDGKKATTPTKRRSSSPKKVEKRKRVEVSASILKDWEEVEKHESEGEEGEELKMPELRIFETPSKVGVALEKVDPDESGRSTKPTASSLFDKLMAATVVPVIPEITEKGEELIDKEEELYEGEELEEELEKNEEIEEDLENLEIPTEPRPPTPPIITTPTPEDVGTPPLQEIPLLQTEHSTPMTTPPPTTKPTATIKPTHQVVMEIEKGEEKIQQGEVGVGVTGQQGEELIEADTVMHLVPVENSDGSITYMLLSLAPNNELRVNVGGAPGQGEESRDLSTLSAVLIDKPIDMATIISNIGNQEMTEEQGSCQGD